MFKNMPKGKFKRTEEYKKKLSISAMGKNTWSRGRKLTVEHRKNISVANKREKSYYWKGGLTDINKLIRRSFEYRLWRTAIFERDNYTCIWCGVRSGNGKKVILNADHIKPFSLFPELRFAIDNGRTLCIDCHKKTDTYASRIFNK